MKCLMFQFSVLRYCNSKWLYFPYWYLIPLQNSLNVETEVKRQVKDQIIKDHQTLNGSTNMSNGLVHGSKLLVQSISMQEKIEEATAQDSKISNIMMNEVFDTAFNSDSSKSSEQVSCCTLLGMPF